MYISSIPGRIRIRTDDQDALQRAAESFSKLDGLLDLQINERTGSLLLRYNDTPEAMTKLEKLLQEHGPPPAKHPTPAKSKAANKAAYMRIAKRGMLSSLGLSMLLAVLDEENWHIATGSLFLGFLGYHLYGYRKRILA